MFVSVINVKLYGYLAFACMLLYCVDAHTAGLVGSAVLLCDNGYSTDGSTCTAYTNGNCPSGSYQVGTGLSTFTAPDVGTGQCSIAGYKPKTISNEFSIVYSGLIIGSTSVLCDNGYSTDGSNCTAYTSGYCPSGYYDLHLNTNTFTAKSSGTCASGYSVHQIQEYCGFDVSSETCVDLCMDGRLTTSLGTCGTLCSLGVTTLRTSNGVVIPLWSSSQKTPSLNIGLNGGVCYGNLTTEQSSDVSLRIQYNNTEYRAVK